MGRGNVCVRGKAEGLFFVDYEFLDVYRRTDGDEDDPEYLSPMEVYHRTHGSYDGWVYDEFESELLREDFEMNLIAMLQDRFKSLRKIDKWIDRYQRAILENDLFYVALEDNEWSIAVELIQKEGTWGDELLGLQIGLYQKYLKAIKEIILDLFGEVGVYAGAWTHGIERKEN